MMLSPRFNYLLSLVLLQVSFLPKLPPAVGAFLSDSNGTVMASMPTYPLSFSNSTFFLDRAPLYVISKAETTNSCEVKEFPSQWPFVVLVHEDTTCGNWDKMINLCDRKGCLGVVFALLYNPLFAGSVAHVARITKSTSRTPVMNMEGFSGPQLEWLLREGSSHPGAVLISARPDEYNEGAALLSSWNFRSIGIIFALHAIANIVAVLWKLLVKLLDLRDDKKMKHCSPTHNLWWPLFVLIPELITGVLAATFWINVSFFRAQGFGWALFRVCIGGTFPFTFISTLTTAFTFYRITLKNQYGNQRSCAHKLAGSLFVHILLCVVVLTDVILTIHSATTNTELVRATFSTAFFTAMQFFCSIYFIVGGSKMIKLLSKGSSSSKLQHAKTLQFANRVRFSGIAMLGFWVTLTVMALSMDTFKSAKSFWYPFMLSAPAGLWVNSAQIRTIVRSRRMNAAEPTKLVRWMSSRIPRQDIVMIRVESRT